MAHHWVYNGMLVVALMSAGMSINYVRNDLEQKQLSFFYMQRTKFMHIISASNQELTALFPNATAWRQHFSTPLPSSYSLASFLADFWPKETYGVCKILRLMMTTYGLALTILSLQQASAYKCCVKFMYAEFNFLTTENIGMSREGDKRWIVQYEALLYVLNSQGQVVTWKLTPGMVFSDVEEVLGPLKKQLDL